MEKIWQKKYPSQVQKEVNFKIYNNIPEVLVEALNNFSSQKAFTNMGVSLSYREVDKLSNFFAAFLQNRLGLKKGDRIAIQMPNLLQYPIVMFGALKAGLIVVNTNPLYTEREMEHQFKDSGVKAIVILANFAAHLERILPNTQIEHIIISEIGDMLPFPKRQIVNSVVKYVKKMVPSYNIPQSISLLECFEIGKSLILKPVAMIQSDIAFLQYTGGTTGVSKGAVLTHGNILANMLQIFTWISPTVIKGKETALTPLPLYHIFSLTVNCLAFMAYGVENILVTNPRDMKDLVKTMHKYPISLMSGVNTLFNALNNSPEFKSKKMPYLKLSVAGAMALQESVAKKWREVTNSSVIEGYGLTEASPVLCVNPVDGTDRLGTIGLPVPGTDIKLVDDSGNEVPIGQPGELCAKGPQIMQGYWNRLDETQKVLIDGWLHTGDIAQVDADGFFKIVDRKKDMILVSGFNVYPNEIEDVLAKHPSVLESAAIGVPDEKSGEAVKIFVVKKSDVTEAELISFCREHLTSYKIPRHVEFRKELPKTNVGKILRRELRK